MHTFKDSAGRTWPLHIDVTAIKRVRELVGVDLLKACEGEVISQLADDPVMLVDVVCALLRPQMDAREITDEQLAEALVGDAIDAASTALVEDLISFFQAGKRSVLTKLHEKLTRLYQAREQVALTGLDAVPLERIIATAMTEAGASSTSSPASAA